MARVSYSVGRMIGWLRHKDPDVWFAITPLLNWDNAVPVLQWILTQPQCDKANAAAIFWGASPAFFAERLAKGEPTNFEGWELIETILRNWQDGFYQRSELAWPDQDGKTLIASYERRMLEVPEARAALPIPREMFGPFTGRQPRVPAELLPSENVELWDLLDRLGTQAGFRPGSELWMAHREGRLQPHEPPQPSLMLRLFGKPNFSPAAIFWLSVAALLVLAGLFAELTRR